MPTDSNKRIAKNTLFLYFRMIVIMLVTLYTARVVLAALGTDDYGIYNVIGGVVVLFSFLNTAMSNATQRFLSFELGKRDEKQLERTFSMSVTSHAILSLIVLIIAETLGLWFASTQMNIPSDRYSAVIWVYQFSVLTFVGNILRVPYNASVIAHERMSFFAYLSILEVVLNLVIALSITHCSYDKLILYAFLKFIITILCWGANYLYCIKYFTCCKYHYFWDSVLFKKIIGFSGWSMLGGGSVLVTQNGSNILINIFCGVAVNAAYGIANQISSAIYGFVSNFQMAFQPQIVKLNAEGKKEEQIILINRASLISYFLLLIICVPFIVNTDVVLGLWLTTVPDYATQFCQLMLFYSLIDAIQAPLWMAIGATGNIKQYTIWSSSFAIMNLPLAWILLKFGYSPVYILVLRVFINFILAVIRTLYVKNLLSFPFALYCKNVVLRAAIVTLASFLITFGFKSFFSDSIIAFLFTTVISVLVTIVSIMLFGLNAAERAYVKTIVYSKIRR